jgi:hypothetical protein
MVKKSPEKFTEICNTIASGILAYSHACKINDVSYGQFWSWIKASQQGDEQFVFEYLGDEIPFHKAVNAARRIALHEMRGKFEQRNCLGWDEAVFFSGMPTWKPDARAVGLDEDTRELLGYRRDGLLEINGQLVQNTIHHEPPVAAVLRTLEMAFPGEYRPTSTNIVQATVNGTMGVGIVPRRSREDGPPQIPPPPPKPLAQLEVIPQSDELTIPETEPEPEPDVTDTEPTVESPDEFIPTTPPEAEVRIIAVPTPPEYAPPPSAPVLMTQAERSGRPLSDLERDLLSRARGSAETRSASPITPTLNRTR